MQKGTIALDIDGTITDERLMLPDEVVIYLTELQKGGWDILFITGREFVYAMDPLSKLSFPFYLAVQNGADLIKMPEKHHVKSFYLDKSVVFAVEKLFEDKKEDFLVYAGYEQGDFCYYRPKQYSEKMVSYLEQMQRRAAEPWVALEHFSSLPQEQFPMIKAMGLEREFIGIEAELLKTHSLNCVVIKDPRREGYSYLLITDYRASKKEAISHFFSLYNLKRPLIVAGDDHNDKESLEYADVRIVMENAPSSLKMLADIIAAPSHHHGIIQGLAQALQLCEQEGFEQRWA